MEAVLKQLSPVLSGPGAWLRSLNPAIHPGGTQDSSVIAEWYLSPEQHILEFFLLVGGYALLQWTMWQFAKKDPIFRQGGLGPRNRNGILLDRMIGTALVIAYLVTVNFKFARGHEIFLLQPCHMWTLVLILSLFLMDTRFHRQGEIIFNVHLNVQWAPWLALATPDLRDYHNPIEIASFFIQHWMITLIPFYILIRNRYAIYRSVSWAVFSHAFWAQYHTLVLLPCSVVFGWNLNYMLAPAPPLKPFKLYYRWVMQPVTNLLSLICYQITQTLVWLFKTRDVRDTMPDKRVAQLKEQKLN